jgi:hypothetical protein
LIWIRTLNPEVRYYLIRDGQDMMNFSDAVLDCAQRSLRLAAECADEHVAVELNLLAIRLLLAAVKDAELIVEPSSVLMSKYCV